MFGNDHNQFTTQNMLTYKNTTTTNYHAHKPQRTANIDLGSHPVIYTS